MAKDDNKGDISRGNLQRYDIFFHPADGDSQYDSNPLELPDHVKFVREGLLEKENIVPDRWINHLCKEADHYSEPDMGSTWSSVPPRSAFIQEEQHEIDRGKHSEQWILADERLARCLVIAKQARDLLKYPEAEWNFFWRRNIFRLFSEEASSQPGFNPTFDQWSLYGEVTWTGFHEWVESCAEEGASDRTMPKPDLTYAFPVQESQPGLSKGFAGDDLPQAFSSSALGKLIEHDIACTPTRALKQWLKASNKPEISEPDRSCFPWAVVEMKRHRTRDKAAIERCYCQAANGAAAALDMQAQLFRRADHELLSRQPPIVTFTCIGPIVKVWLTYRNEPDPLQRPKKLMVCIWTTSVQLTWGVASLRAILINMHIWASRLLKPKLQGCVHRISASLQHMSPDYPGASSSRAPSSKSNLPPSEAIRTSKSHANEPGVGTGGISPQSNLPQTPQRQRAFATGDSHRHLITETTLRKPQTSSDRTLSDLPGPRSQVFGASDWNSVSFNFEFNLDTDRSHRLDGSTDPSSSYGVCSIDSESPEEPSGLRSHCVPTPPRSTLFPTTPQAQRRKDVSPPTGAASSSRSALATPVPGNKIRAIASMESRRNPSDPSDQIDQTRSPKAGAVATCRSSHVNDLSNSKSPGSGDQTPSETANEGSEEERDSSDKSIETYNAPEKIQMFGQPPSAIEEIHHNTSLDHNTELGSKLAREFGTPQRQIMRPTTASDDLEDEATPRPSTRTDNSRSDFFGIYSSSGVSKDHTRGTGLFNQGSPLDHYSPHANCDDTSSSATRDKESGLREPRSSTEQLEISGLLSSATDANSARDVFDVSGLSQALPPFTSTSTFVSGLSRALPLYMSSVISQSDASDDSNDSDYSPDSDVNSASGDDEFSDVPTESDVISEQEQDDDDIRSWSGRSTDSFRQ